MLLASVPLPHMIGVEYVEVAADLSRAARLQKLLFIAVANRDMYIQAGRKPPCSAWTGVPNRAIAIRHRPGI
jgi:hypothetical protein